MTTTAQTTAARVQMPEPALREHPAAGLHGFVGLFAGLVLLPGGGLAGAASAGGGQEPLDATLAVVGVLLGGLMLHGLITVAPGEAKVLQFFGRYIGTVRTPGLRWVNPLTSRRKVSTRIRNHESDVLKVNDNDGNPTEIAAVVVWQVADTARAVFEVDSFVAFVHTQTETAIRHIATSYPYDDHRDAGFSLRGNADEITERLCAEIAARVESARVRIVEGAVGMVDMALARVSERDIVELDEERKAAMVSNLLVVLCGDRATQPVVNTGSLYH